MVQNEESIYENFYYCFIFKYGGAIEVCKNCGMSRHHWEWGNSNWIMIEDIEKARKKLQKGIDYIYGVR